MMMEIYFFRDQEVWQYPIVSHSDIHLSNKLKIRSKRKKLNMKFKLRAQYCNIEECML